MKSCLAIFLSLLLAAPAAPAPFTCLGVDDTVALQAAVDAGDVEISGTCLVKGYPGVRVPSNRTINATGATLRQTANQGGSGALGRNRIFETIPDSANIAFRGGTYIGRRDPVAGLQWSIGIRVDKATNVVLEGVTFQDWYFDGLYIGGNAPGSTYVTVRDVVISNSKRNGLSIVNGSKIRVYNSIFETSNCISDAVGGVCSNFEQNMPLCGIDFEPNAGDKVDDVIFVDNLIRNNQKCGIFLQDNAKAGKHYVFVDNTFENNGGLLTNDFQVALNQVKRVIFDSNTVTGGSLGVTVGNAVEDLVLTANVVSNTSQAGYRFAGANNPFAAWNKTNGEDVFFVAIPGLDAVSGNVELRPFE